MKENEEKGTTTSKNSGYLLHAIIQVSLCVFSYAGLCIEFPARSVIQQLFSILLQFSCSFLDILKCINLLFPDVPNELATSEDTTEIYVKK